MTFKQLHRNHHQKRAEEFIHLQDIGPSLEASASNDTADTVQPICTTDYSTPARRPSYSFPK